MEQKGQNWGIKGRIRSSINKKLINYAIWLSYGTVSVPSPEFVGKIHNVKVQSKIATVEILRDLM